MGPVPSIVEWLDGLGAATVEHPGGLLLPHLQRTAAILEAWGVRPALVRAGLAHAVYGTDAFPVALVDPAERDSVREVLGDEAEAIVWRYGGADRSFVHPKLDRPALVTLRSRFGDPDLPMDDRQLADYLTLTVANELDVARHHEGLAVELWPWLRKLTLRWPIYLPAGARGELAAGG